MKKLLFMLLMLITAPSFSQVYTAKATSYTAHDKEGLHPCNVVILIDHDESEIKMYAEGNLFTYHVISLKNQDESTSIYKTIDKNGKNCRFALIYDKELDALNIILVYSNGNYMSFPIDSFKSNED